MIDSRTRKKLLASQRNEITEHIIYGRLARKQKNPHNRKLLEGMARDELSHYNFWKKQTGEDAGPKSLKIFWYYWISVAFGLTFGLKLMENGEEMAQDVYEKISKHVPGVKKIIQDENRHESELVGMIDEEKLRYVGSIVLGINDALVELTGALAGFTLALQNTSLIAMTGLITGVAAALSMAASEYLSTKSEATEASTKNPLRASIYTGTVYMVTVLLLVAPFLLLQSIYLSLGITIAIAILVIFVFTFYISVAKELPFRRRFAEMAAISLGVAGISFLLGMAIKMFLGV
jgi:VIT1/CCC1 family predicted Fe2+/Mn2+ transporter